MGLAVLGGAQAQDRTGPPVPVLLVHGSGLTSASWEALQALLRQRGYPDDYLEAVDLLPSDGSNRAAAVRQLEPAMSRLLIDARRTATTRGWPVPDKIDVIAHSMGAVSSRLLSARHPSKVRRWIGIAPANHGTNALCGYPGEGSRELCPAFASSAVEGSVQAELNGTLGKPVDETPFGLGLDARSGSRVAPDPRRSITYYTIRIDPDRWIVPAGSAVLDGAGGLAIRVPAGLAGEVVETSPGNYLITEALDHDSMPADPTVMRLVELILGAPDPVLLR